MANHSDKSAAGSTGDSIQESRRGADIGCRMRLWLAALVVLSVLTLAPPAAASARWTGAPTAAIAATARVPWTSSHCYGREVVTILTPAEMNARRGPDVDGYVADVGDPACMVWIRSGLYDYRACAVLTHEFGHLAGMGHSSNPRSVMYLDAPTPERCWRQFAGRLRS